MKYIRKTVNQICELLENGVCQRDAAQLIGISEDTFYEWKNTKSEFSESVERAILMYKFRLIQVVNVGTVKNPRLALEILARKWPSEWGEKQMIQNYERPEDKLERVMDLIKEATENKNPQEQDSNGKKIYENIQDFAQGA